MAMRDWMLGLNGGIACQVGIGGYRFVPVWPDGNLNLFFGARKLLRQATRALHTAGK